MIDPPKNNAPNHSRPIHHGLGTLRGCLFLFCMPVFLICFGSAARGGEKKTVAINIRPIDPKEAAKVTYKRDIKPLLVNACVECHSTEDHKGGLDVTSIAAMKKGGKKAGPSIIPGKPDDSPIVKYIRGLADGPQMPKGEPELSEGDLHLIRSWIAAGALDR
jgi:hypothetical protein